MPINHDPSGPGIRLANIRFLLPSNLSTIITANIANTIVNVKHHTLDSFKSMTCKHISIEYSTNNSSREYNKYDYIIERF